MTDKSQVIKYPYSKGQIYFGMIVFSAMFLLGIYLLIVNIDPDVWILDLIVLAMGGIGFNFFKKYFSPCLKGKTALELDSKKLEYFISNKTVYWRDVDYIDSRYGGRGRGLEVSFAIKQSNRNITISTRYIAGNDEDIYNTISEYFKKYKQVDYHI